MDIEASKINQTAQNSTSNVSMNGNQEKKDNPFAKFKIDDTNLVDEDDLLANEPSYNPLAKAEDCSTKPKACKNCSCGRKEME